LNKYDFDFRRVEDVLYETFGIANPTDIIALKMQIRESLSALEKSIDAKRSELKNVSEERIQAQKNMLYKELDSIASEKDLEKVLRKCIEVRRFSILGLEEKVRPEDSHQVRSEKMLRKSEIFGLCELINGVDSIINLMEERNRVLRLVDSSERIIKFDKMPPEHGADGIPGMKLSINFQPRPDGFPDRYAECLQEAGIYAYNFGDLICFDEPNGEGLYTREVSRKKLVGIIKRDEFEELRKYSVLMNDEFEDIPPEFYRDILFSDMLLRNAKKNFNVLGIPEEYPEDNEYGYRVGFEEFGLEELLRAMHFENDQSIVTIETNFERATDVSKACSVMQEKMEQAIRELEASHKRRTIDKDDDSKTLGDE